MEGETLSHIEGYENIAEYYLQNINKCGLLLDEHNEALHQFWLPVLKKSTTFHPFAMKAIKLCTSTLRNITGDRSVIIPLGILIPAGIHYLTFKLKQLKENKCMKNIDELTLIMRKFHELIKAVERYYQKRFASVENLKPQTKILVNEVLAPKLNVFLYTVCKIIVEIVVKINDLMLKVDAITRIGDLKSIYAVPLEQIDLTVPSPKFGVALKEYYEHCDLLYSFVGSSFLCSIALGLCCQNKQCVKCDCKKLFDVIIPEALEIIHAGYLEVAHNFRNIYTTLMIIEIPVRETLQLAGNNKLMPVNNMLQDFMRKVQLIFDVAGIMQMELQQQSNYFNIGCILEAHYLEVEKLFSECQDALNNLKINIFKQVSTKQREAVNRQNQKLQPTRARNEENKGEAVIRHDDPDRVANNEEYNLSIHDSDDEEIEKTCAVEYAELVEYIRAQKIMIEELNMELKKKKLITQEEIASGKLKQNVKAVYGQEQFKEEKQVPLPSCSTAASNVPPLPPPPLPQFNFRDAQENEVPLPSCSTSIPFLAPSTSPLELTEENLNYFNAFNSQIQAMARNWGIDEEVFEYDFDLDLVSET